MNWLTKMMAPLRAKTADRSAENTLLRIVQPSARTRWMSAVARHYTPENIEQVLRGALSGNLVAQWQLFDLMEDTWPRLQKDLNELKDAVVSQDWSVQPFALKGEKPSRDAQRRAKLFEQAIWSMRPRPEADENDFGDTIKDVLDAWGKGISVLEVQWELRPLADKGLMYVPRCTSWIHPQYYGYPFNGSELGLDLRALSTDGQTVTLPDRGDGFAAFPEHKFLLSLARQKSGPTAGAALLRPLAWWWCAANFSQEWLLNFAQIFGLPIRWATYDLTKPGLLNQICDMLENMGSAAWAAFPAGTTLELKEPMKSGADNPQVALLDRADKQVDLLILGQTLTSDVGSSGSRALGEVHAGVKSDRKQAVSAHACKVLDQLARSFCCLNFGDDCECPWLQGTDEEAGDAKAMADRDKVLLDAGLPLPRTWLYERHEIPIPAPDEPVITGHTNTAPAAIGHQPSAIGNSPSANPNPQSAIGNQQFPDSHLPSATPPGAPVSDPASEPHAPPLHSVKPDRPHPRVSVLDCGAAAPLS